MELDPASVGFAARLRDAVTRRGLPLARVQAHLAAAGHPVALSTLSQWQHGRRLPQSPRSLAVVDEIERVLRVEPGSLRGLLTRPADGAASAARPALPELGSAGEIFVDLATQLGRPAPDALLTLGSHERITIDARGAMTHRSTTTAARALAPIDRYVMSCGVEDGSDVDLVTIRAGSGCRLGRVARDREAGLIVAELHFDRRLALGETVLFDVHIDDANGVVGHDYFHWSTHVVDLLVIEVTFHPDRVPNQVVAFERANPQAPDRTAVEMALERGDRVHIARTHAEPGLHGIRWSWGTP